MRIDRNTSDKISIRRLLRWAGGLLSFLLVAGIIYYVSTSGVERSGQHVFFCGAEVFKDGKFVTDKLKFGTSCIQDRSVKHSGEASCKCSGDSRYGPTASLDNLVAGDSVEISLMVMSTNNSETRVVFSSDLGHYHAETLETIPGAWRHYIFHYTIPVDTDRTRWKIYPYMAEGAGPVYYDDIRISWNDTRSQKEQVTFPDFEMQINSSNFAKIIRKREEAKKIGLLFSSKEDLVPADFKVEGETYSCQTRLKGDLLDHLRSDKWSFRVVLDGKETWNGMHIFSIHNSKARSHLAEWAMHRIMADEGILSPKYDFMTFHLNGKRIGVYAYEQHFDNYFLLDNERIVAPIIRHNDDGYWNNAQGLLKDFEWAEASQIELFNKENASDEDFMKLYRYGHSALNDYLKGNKKANEVFDIEKMAKYYALIEIGHGLHAQLLTNIRFYVNPTSGLLEPIGYDFYGDHMPNINEHWRPVGQWENGENIIERSRDGYGYMRRLFGDLEFYQRYMHHLEKYASERYLNALQARFQNEIMAREQLITTDSEYQSYGYDMMAQFRKAAYTRAKIYPLSDVSLKSYRSADKATIYVQGYHYFPLEIIGYREEGRVTTLEESIILEAYSPEVPVEMVPIPIASRARELVYKTLGTDSLHYHLINKDAPPIVNIPSQQSLLTDIGEHPQISLQGDSYTLSSAVITIDRHYVVPQETTLLIPKSTQISLIGTGSITVYGKILAVGSASEPIIIKGESRKGQGVLISGDGESVFAYCHISQLGSYAVGAVNLEAALYLNETAATLSNTRIGNNATPSDLKVANSTCSLTNVRFSDNAGDAIQSRFSTLIIDQISGANYGGTFLDQKGGKVTGSGVHCESILGDCIETDLHADMSITDFSIQDCGQALDISGNSQVVINGYRGKAKGRDIEVTGTGSPATSVFLSSVFGAGDLEYIMEPGTSLTIDGSKKVTR